MTAHDPKQAISEYVSLPLGIVHPNPPLPVPAQGQRPRGELRRGGGLGAQVGTIRFFQERLLPHRQIHEVTFEGEAGQLQHWFCFVVQEQQGGWRMVGGANIANAKHSPVRDHPWINLAGGGWEDQFWAGGRVLDNGLDVVRVRLISKNGQVLEDLVQDGLVLFISDQKIQMPVQVELYDRAGNLVGTHPCFHR